MEFKYQVTRPLGICDKCLKDPDHAGEVAGKIYVIYCTHTAVGGFMMLKDGKPSNLWQIMHPISKMDFMISISKGFGILDKIESAVEFEKNEIDKLHRYN